MTWKAIGQSVIGTSHIQAGKGCEDALQYGVLAGPDGGEVLVCCVSDGAGSAMYAGWASAFATTRALAVLSAFAHAGTRVAEGDIYAMAEDIYDGLAAEAEEKKVPVNEFSCTLLGCIIAQDWAAFFQVGDGAMVRNDGSGFYTPVYWPQNGEYQNSTQFVIDDRSMGHLAVTVVDAAINEVALFTDGLQMLALNMEGCTVHQPFFTSLYPLLRMATDTEKINLLGQKLAAYLGGKAINDRTDDDKTLFLATKLESER